jgi:hypothetical protein
MKARSQALRPEARAHSVASPCGDEPGSSARARGGTGCLADWPVLQCPGLGTISKACRRLTPPIPQTRLGATVTGRDGIQFAEVGGDHRAFARAAGTSRATAGGDAPAAARTSASTGALPQHRPATEPTVEIEIARQPELLPSCARPDRARRRSHIFFKRAV